MRIGEADRQEERLLGLGRQFPHRLHRLPHRVAVEQIVVGHVGGLEGRTAVEWSVFALLWDRLAGRFEFRPPLGDRLPTGPYRGFFECHGGTVHEAGSSMPT